MSDGTYNYTYDADGNRIKQTNIATWASATYTTTYTYDFRNRLTDAVTAAANGTPTGHVHYVYDVNDHLILREVDSTGSGVYTISQSFVYDGAQLVLVFTNGSLTNRLFNGPGLNNVLADDNVATGGTLWLLTNQEGTVTDVVDNNGTDVDHRVYSAFGQLVSSTAAVGSQAAADQYLFGYTGAMSDPTTGLIYEWHRWLDPSTGTWISQDPLGFAAGDANINRYVGNDPTAGTDPMGLRTWGQYFDDNASYAWSAASTFAAVGAQNIASAGYSMTIGMLTGETGAALGGRAVDVTEQATGKDFSGTLNEQATFGRAMAGEVTGMNSIAQAYEGADIGADLKTQDPTLDSWQRWENGLMGFGQALLFGIGAFKSGMSSIEGMKSSPTTPKVQPKTQSPKPTQPKAPEEICPTLPKDGKPSGGSGKGGTSGNGPNPPGGGSSGQGNSPNSAQDAIAQAKKNTGNYALYKFEELEANPGLLRPNERVLDLPDRPITWAENQAALQDAMNEGLPIRDGSPTKTGGNLQLEREYLMQNNWKFDPETGYWNPRRN